MDKRTMKSAFDKGIYGLAGLVVGALISYLVTTNHYQSFIQAGIQYSESKPNHNLIEAAGSSSLNNSLIAFKSLDYPQADTVITGNIIQLTVINKVSGGSVISKQLWSTLLLALSANENSDEVTQNIAEQNAIALCRQIFYASECNLPNLYKGIHSMIDAKYGSAK